MKYKNSGDKEIKLKKCNNNHIQNQQAKVDKDGERIRLFKYRKKNVR